MTLALHAQLLSVALKAAVYAGKEILTVYSGPFDITLKDDKSPLTEADKKAHHKIISILEETGLPVLSEEGKSIHFETRSKWKRFWMVDPLDGTKEFIKRNGEFTVNIALIENNEAVAGVVYAPVMNTLYFGIRGWGSYRIEADADYLAHLTQSMHAAERMKSLSSPLPLASGKRPFTVVASRSHLSEETSAYIEELKKIHGEVALVSKGSSLKICLVAEGSADIYPRFAPTMEWDTAAGQAVAQAAGLQVINAHDRVHSLLYNKEDLLNPWFIVQT